MLIRISIWYLSSECNSHTAQTTCLNRNTLLGCCNKPQWDLWDWECCDPDIQINSFHIPLPQGLLSPLGSFTRKFEFKILCRLSSPGMWNVIQWPQQTEYYLTDGVQTGLPLNTNMNGWTRSEQCRNGSHSDRAGRRLSLHWLVSV